MTAKNTAEAYVREKLGLTSEVSRSKGHVDDDWHITYVHDLALQHWLRVLEEKMQITLQYDWQGMSLYGGQDFTRRINFDPLTGQPKDEADYVRFNQIVGI